jgi:hypothetical protein
MQFNIMPGRSLTLSCPQARAIAEDRLNSLNEQLKAAKQQGEQEAKKVRRSITHALTSACRSDFRQGSASHTSVGSRMPVCIGHGRPRTWRTRCSSSRYASNNDTTHKWKRVSRFLLQFG